MRDSLRERWRVSTQTRRNEIGLKAIAFAPSSDDKQSLNGSVVSGGFDGKAGNAQAQVETGSSSEGCDSFPGGSKRVHVVQLTSRYLL